MTLTRACRRVWVCVRWASRGTASELPVDCKRDNHTRPGARVDEQLGKNSTGRPERKTSSGSVTARARVVATVRLCVRVCAIYAPACAW